LTQANIWFLNLVLKILFSEKKRKTYDQFGEEGLKGQMGEGVFSGDPREIFSQFFGPGANPFEEMMGGSGMGGNAFTFSGGMPGGSNGFSSSGGMPGGSNGFIDIAQMFGGGGLNGFGTGGTSGHKEQNPAVEHTLNLTLEELYSGCTKKMKISRNVVSGGNQTKKEEKIVSVDVKPGWKAGTKITFPKEGDQMPGKIPSDVIFVVGEKKHHLFERDGNDLKHKAPITLKQALCGRHTVSIPTIEGERLQKAITRPVDPKTVDTLKGRGMPISKLPGKRGDLHVSYDISFPKHVSESDQQKLLKILDTYQ